jgi:ABC-type multidrug transport system fused ATPase/permease subunit
LIDQTAGNSSLENITSVDEKAIYLAKKTSLSLEIASIVMAPLTLGRLFHGQKKNVENYCPAQAHAYYWILIVAMASQLAAYSWNMIMSSSKLVQQVGFTNTMFLFLLPYGIHWGNYLFLKFLVLFLPVTLMTKLTRKCLNAAEATIATDSRTCILEYRCLKSNIGPLLLTFTSIDSLFVMLYSFVGYMAMTFQDYVFLLVFVLFDLNGILSLFYICFHCDQCFNAMQNLLSPLRCIRK